MVSAIPNPVCLLIGTEVINLLTEPDDKTHSKLCIIGLSV